MYSMINLWTNLVSFVTEEVNFIETIKISQAVCFVPTLRENLGSIFKLRSVDLSPKIKSLHHAMKIITYIKTYLSSNGECQVKMSKLLTKYRNHFWAYVVKLRT